MIGEIGLEEEDWADTRVGTLIVATIYLQLIQNRYISRDALDVQNKISTCFPVHFIVAFKN